MPPRLYALSQRRFKARTRSHDVGDSCCRRRQPQVVPPSAEEPEKPSQSPLACPVGTHFPQIPTPNNPSANRAMLRVARGPESFVAPGSQQDAPNQARSKGASPECMKLLTSKHCRHTAGSAESVDVCGACLLWVVWAPSCSIRPHCTPSLRRSHGWHLSSRWLEWSGSWSGHPAGREAVDWNLKVHCLRQH